MTGDAVLQYVVNAIVTATSIGAVTFAWRTNAEATRIRTILCEPKMGMVDRMTDQETRIERNERRIADLDRDKMPRMSVNLREAERRS